MKLDHRETNSLQRVNPSSTRGVMPRGSVEGEGAIWQGARMFHGENIPEVATCIIMWNHKTSQHILRITSAPQLLDL